MKFIDLALKDLHQLVIDWKSGLFLLAAPVVFTLLFGFMFGGFDGVEVDSRLPIQIADEDQTTITTSLIAYLENSNVLQVESITETKDLDHLKQAVADDDLAAVLLIPEGFSDQLQSSGEIKFDTILKENTTAGMTVLQEIQGIASRVQSAAKTAELTVTITEAQNPGQSLDKDALYVTAFEETLQAWENPPVTALETQTAPDGTQETSEENAFAQSLPGMMAQFAIAGLMGASAIIVQERKDGAFDRLLGTAVPKFSILIGHWLAMFGLIFAQFIILVIFGQLFLRLDFLAAPWATLLLSIGSCAFVASMGLMIGILSKEPEHSIIMSLIPMFIFSGLGGAWVPLDILGEQVQQISRFTPVYWIMVGFRDILLRGANLAGIQVSILALLGFSVLFFIPAVILFYRRRV